MLCHHRVVPAAAWPTASTCALLFDAVKLQTDPTSMRVTESILDRLREARDFVVRVEKSGVGSTLSRFFKSGNNLTELKDIGRRILEAQQPLQIALNRSVSQVLLMSAAVFLLCKTRVQCGFHCCQLGTEQPKSFLSIIKSFAAPFTAALY